jgi:hypothetical protein
MAITTPTIGADADSWGTILNTALESLDTRVEALGNLKGEPGDAASVEVGTVTTGAPGTEAAVVNSGTDSAVVLDFTIPQGEAGTGTGTVSSVNTVAPDAGGDVTLGWDDISGSVPTSKIPAAAIVKPTAVADEAAMLALVAQGGDVAVRGDGAGTFMLKENGDPSVLGDWMLLNSPTDAVSSVNGQTGTVVLGASDVSALPDTYAPTSSEISDATTTGKAVLTAASQTAARTAIGAGTSSFSGSYADLSGTPTLGTAAALDAGTAAGDVPTLDGNSGNVLHGDGSWSAASGGTPGSWTEITTFGTHTTQSDGTTYYTAACRLEADAGLVRLRGAISATGTVAHSEAVATLPAGFRPAKSVVVSATNPSGGGVLTVQLTIASTGVVTCKNSGTLGATQFISLDGITFNLTA